MPNTVERPPNSVEVVPAGHRVEYWDSVGVDGEGQQRRYRVAGEKCDSVTTVLGVLNKPALVEAAVKLARQGIDYREKWGRAAGRGTDVHAVVVAALLKERVSLADLDDEARPYGQAGYRWLRARAPQIVAAEQMVGCPKLKLAGRLDLLAEVGGFLEVIDFKTVGEWAFKWRQVKGVKVQTDEKLPPYDENLLQLDLYAELIARCQLPTPDRGRIVRLGPDGTYDETVCRLNPSRGLAILEAYRVKAATGKALRDARAA